jgi:UDP-N-acetylglucosamine--N-acetylmuramyl-(pentapeptide) pyrophosphoryl-undecaprenol N-acetylglucosamine transferase
MKKKILIAVGGTGGHLYPAQALAQRLKKEYPSTSILFVGGGLAANPFFSQEEYDFEEVACETFYNKNVMSSLVSCGKIAKGVCSSVNVMRKFKPDVVVGFGSHQSLPPLVAAKMRGAPIVLHEANSMPGKVNRFFSRYARLTGVFFPDASMHLKGRSLCVDMPLREGYSPFFFSQREARDYFHLDSEKFTFLVFGGSQGALALNTHICSAMMTLAERSTRFQVIHCTGSAIATEEIKAVYEDLGIQASVRTFEERMEYAWRAADLVISRAGAMTVAEQIAMEVPTILIPYPFALDDHQDKNADFVVNKLKAGVKIREKDLSSESFARTVSEFLAYDGSKLAAMRENIREYKRKKYERDFSSVVCEIAGIKVR